MRWKDTKKLQNLLIITKEAFRQLEPDEQALNSNLSYWIKNKQLIILKKGFYVCTQTYDNIFDKACFLEYLANQIYSPSYLSFEYVMQKYGLLTEAVYGITSASTKKTKDIKNNLGQFSYYSLSPKIFTGFEIINTPLAPVIMATKSKAIFDFLYLRYLKQTPVNEKSIKELRINWENVNKTEYNQIKKYSKMCTSKKVEQAINIIYEIYHS